nr:hypothetical protein [Frigoribacterium sp. CG_9.8]
MRLASRHCHRGLARSRCRPRRIAALATGARDHRFFGGAVALGHLIGASGARIVGHLALRLAALGSDSVGAAGICGGGGQGAALVLTAL